MIYGNTQSVTNVKMYQDLLKDYNRLQEKYDTKDKELAKLSETVRSQQDGVGSIQDKLQKLKFENQKLYNDCRRLKQRQTQEKALSEESFRKKVKRLTGELDMLETYFTSLHELFIESLPRCKHHVAQDEALRPEL